MCQELEPSLHRLTGWLGRLNVLDQSVGAFPGNKRQGDAVRPTEDSHQELFGCTLPLRGEGALSVPVGTDMHGSVHSPAIDKGQN